LTTYSYQNQLQFGYGPQAFNRRDHGLDLWYNFNRAERQPISFVDELKRTAQVVYEQARAMGRPIYLLLSGGLDSAVMVKGFKAAGVPFKTATYVFNDGLNEHEMQYIRPFEAAENLDAVHLNMDIRKWMHDGEALDLFLRTDSWETGTLPLMKLMGHVWSELGGLPVFGGGDIDIVQKEGAWYYGRYESFLSRYWYCDIAGISDFVSFFQHTPELTLAMLSDPLIARAATGQDQLANRVLRNLKIVKFKVYHRDFPDLQRRIKFGGTELIHSWLSPLEDSWRAKRQLSYGDLWMIPYDELMEKLRPLGSVY